jgi:hypothetical protein
MKIQKLLTEHAWVAPWDFDLAKTTIDQKGKVDSIYPELKGEAQCPFWKTLKSKIHGEAGDGVKVPKSFAIEVAKEYKIPLDPSYSTPCCICSGKSCTFFGGIAGGRISCNFKVGAKPIKKAQGFQEDPRKGTTQAEFERGREDRKQSTGKGLPGLEKEGSVHPTFKDSNVPAENFGRERRK